MSNQISYVVHMCDWEAIHNPEHDELPFEEWSKLPEADCSDKLDDRTWRSRSFPSQEEAEAYVQQVIENRKDENGKEDKWLALIEIKKHTIELIKKIK